jgi:cytoskeleton protein RodZ
LKEEGKLSVGAYLSQERKQKNISLPDVAKVTRISIQYLEALEKDEFQTLPASIFVRGFLRTYAAQIGLDPREILNMYEAQMDSLHVPEKKGGVVPPKKLDPLGKYILTLLIIVLGVGIAFFFFKETSVPPPPSPSSLEIPPAQTPGAKAHPSAALPSHKKEALKGAGPAKPEKKSEGLPAAAAVPSEGLKKIENRHLLKVKAIDKTWMRIQADDQPEFEVLLQPKETVSWTAQNRFKILVGNAGGVEISFDGNPQGPLGKSGEVVYLLLPNGIKPRPEEKREQGEKSL